MVGRNDDWMQVLARRDGIDIDPALLAWPGIATFKRALGIFRERGYRARLLVAAYRHFGHWSELIGGDFIHSMPCEWAQKANALPTSQSPNSINRTRVEEQIVGTSLPKDPGFQASLRSGRDDGGGIRRVRRDGSHFTRVYRGGSRADRRSAGFHAAESGCKPADRLTGSTFLECGGTSHGHTAQGRHGQLAGRLFCCPSLLSVRSLLSLPVCSKSVSRSEGSA